MPIAYFRFKMRLFQPQEIAQIAQATIVRVTTSGVYLQHEIAALLEYVFYLERSTLVHKLDKIANKREKWVLAKDHCRRT